jgi:hypothetical protein
MTFKKGGVMQYDELCQVFIGKGKIQPLQIIPASGGGGGYKLLYQEGKKKNSIFCDDRTELEKILVEFGGQNPETCKAPKDLYGICLNEDRGKTKRPKPTKLKKALKQYYNTNRLDRDQLRAASKSNEKQQEKVLRFFQENPNRLFATFQIRQLLMPKAPHTSAQRCISNLTDMGLLQKTDYMMNGPYNKQVHTWCLKMEVDRQPRPAATKRTRARADGVCIDT